MNTVSKFRQLTPEETALVAGGSSTVTVWGTPELDWGWFYFSSGWSSGDGSGGGGGGGGDTGETPSAPPELSDAEEEATKDSIQALIAVLDENIKKYGDATIKLPNGSEVLASEILDALGKTLDIIEAGNLAWEAANGNADVAEVAGFIAGLAGGAVAAAAGAGPIAVFAAGVGIGLLTEAGLNQIAQNFSQAWNEAYQNIEQANPGYTSGMNLYLFIQSLFGNTTDPFDEDPLSYNPNSEEPYWSYAYQGDGLRYEVPTHV
jgi:hypothetical protein